MKKRIAMWIFSSVLLWLVPLNNAYPKEKYVLGGSENPWETSWSQSSRESITLLEGTATSLKTKGIDTAIKPGWIKPIEVIPTENLLKGLYERGGAIDDAWAYASQGPTGYVDIAGEAVSEWWSSPKEVELLMADGDPTTLRSFKGGGWPIWKVIRFDLGTQFTITKVRAYPRIVKSGNPEEFPKGYEFSTKFMPEYSVFFNDGSPESVWRSGYYFGKLAWQLYRREKENRQPFVEIEVDPPQLVRYILLVSVVGIGKEWEIAEFEAYGRGFVSEATYVSNIIDLGQPVAWGMLKWEGVAPKPGSRAKVLIQTRTGDDNDPNLYFRKTGAQDYESIYTQGGDILDKASYNSLGILEKGHIEYDHENWSPWSAPYTFEDWSAYIISPGPKRFMQIRVNFINTSDDAGSLKTLEFEYSKPPLATELLGEIIPVEVEPAKVGSFTYAVKPTVGEKDIGFDSLEIITPVPISPDKVKSVTLDGKSVDLALFPPESLKEPTGFAIHFPRIGTAESGKIIKVQFEALILKFGISFDGRVFDSKRDEVKQRIDPGDADPDLQSNTLSVRIPLGGSIIASVLVTPKVITPNGDNTNDIANISFSVVQITKPDPISVEIYDLGGRLLKTVFSEKKPYGQYTCTWNGKDDNNKLVPPGVYVYKISAEVEDSTQTSLGTIVVAY